MSTLQPIETVSLRISVTDRCQFRCQYCMPPDGVPLAPHKDILRFEESVAFAAAVHRLFGLAKVRITGGEPLIRRGILGLVRELAGLGIPDLALTTNGVRLPEMAADLRRAGLRRVNISLDSLDAATYRRLTCGGQLPQALAGVTAARQAGFESVKLNMVVMRGLNDGEVVEMARFGIEHGGIVRFLELMPLGPAAAHHEEWFIPSAEVRDRLASAFDLRPLPHEPASSSRNYAAQDAECRRGTIGFISPCSEPFCRDCRRLRLTSTGRLIGCLAQEAGADVRAILRAPRPPDEERIAEAVEQALGVKRGVRHFAERRLMVRIGG